MSVVIRRPCMWGTCTAEAEVAVPAEAEREWRGGTRRPIQDVFWMLTPQEREQIKSGYCKEHIDMLNPAPVPNPLTLREALAHVKLHGFGDDVEVDEIIEQAAISSLVDDENPRWSNNELQFARLLCEIVATQDLDAATLLDSMDLDGELLDDLFERANDVWEAGKAAVAGFGQ